MRCKKKEFIKGEYFHIYNRSVENTLIFKSADDYLYFLDKFNPKITTYPASVFAYCLMPNHFHFLLRQDNDKPIYQIFSDINNSYVQHYNNKYSRKGHLYEGPLQHKRVKKENYIISLCQYIHYNPKKARLVDNLSDWKYSNYLEWIGKRNGILFNEELLKIYFGSPELYRKQIKYYEKYIKEKEFAELLFD